MLDIKDIRKRPEHYEQVLASRGQHDILSGLLGLDANRRALIVESDELRHSKSVAEKGMRTADKSGPEFAEFRDQMRDVAKRIKEVTEQLKVVEQELNAVLLTIPNAPHEAVPDGSDESSNEVVHEWGQKPAFDFEPRPHWDVAGDLGLLDFEAAAKISGARFAVYRGALARLERALISYMLDQHTDKHGYIEVLPPYLVHPRAMFGTGQFPKFADDAYVLEKDELVLIPTAEVPLTNIHRDEILEAAELPIRYATCACFRREAGAYGRDTEGLIGSTNFKKWSSFNLSGQIGDAAPESLTSHAEEILRALGLHYRRVNLCAGDLGLVRQT